MLYSKFMTGSLAADGVVQMNQGQPRPQRETAVSTIPLGDGPYPHFDAQNLARATANIAIDTGVATVTVQGSNGDPALAPSWANITATDGLDGGAGVGATQRLAFDLDVKFLRFVVSGIGAGTVSVEFFGQS